MQTASDMSFSPLPIYIIGAGGIVTSAHLPAYKIAGFDVQGIYDIVKEKAKQAAGKFAISKVFDTLELLLQDTPATAVFDIAVPGKDIISVLEQLPDGANVLMQKPMGENLAAAKQILEITRRKKMNAAVNFQLRYAPFILEAKKMMNEGLLGIIKDIEINVNVYTPWHLWKFLFGVPRVEILYHSIHYIDLVRNLLGNPRSVYAKTTGSPDMKELASVKSNIILDYGGMIGVNIHTNHSHDYGTQKQHSYIKLEGNKGAIKISMGILMNYPEGEPDKFEYILKDEGDTKAWKTKKINGSWFPHGFIGSMKEVMIAAGGSQQPGNSVEDCIQTMACVEAAYHSSEIGGERPEF